MSQQRCAKRLKSRKLFRIIEHGTKFGAVTVLRPMKEKLLIGSSTALRFAVIALLVWATIGAIAFGMGWSVAAGAAALVALASWDRLPVWPRRAFALASPFIIIVFVAQIAAPEYMTASDSISCKVRHTFGDNRSFCDDLEFDRLADDHVGPVLSVREQWAVRWLNVTMAAGGTLLGFEDVAWETLLLMRGSTAEVRARTTSLPLSQRRVLCDQGRANAMQHYDGNSTIALESSRARKSVARLAEQLDDQQSATAQLRWRNYASPDQTWATTLALWVPQSTMTVRRDGDELHTTWTGTILYPATSQVAVELPRPIGASYRFALDESLFCAAQLDGVFVPYQMSWNASLSTDDNRLRAPRINENSPGLIESFVRPLSNEIGFWHSARTRPATQPRTDQ